MSTARVPPGHQLSIRERVESVETGVSLSGEVPCQLRWLVRQIHPSLTYQYNRPAITELGGLITFYDQGSVASGPRLCDHPGAGAEVT